MRAWWLLCDSRRVSGSWLLALEIYPPDGYTIDGQPWLSPDGRQVAFLARDRAGKTSGFVRHLDATAPKRLLAEVQNVAGCSADSRFLAFFAGGFQKKVDVSGGTVQTICERGPGDRLLLPGTETVSFS